MSASGFCGVLKEWEGQEVTVINPESYSLGQLGDKLAFESYAAKVVGVMEDCIHISFTRPKKGADTEVIQYIPLSRVKRVSLWGGEKYIQI